MAVGVGSELGRLEKTGWYDRQALQELGLYKEEFFDGRNGFLTKTSDGTRYVLGASVMHYKRQEKGLKGTDYIDLVGLAIALQNPHLFEAVDEQPDLFVQRALQGFKVTLVPIANLHKLAKYTVPEDRLEQELEKYTLREHLPEVKLSFPQMTYLFTHGNTPPAQLAREIGIPETVVQLALYKLGLQPLPTKEALLELKKKYARLSGKSVSDVSPEALKIIAKKYPYYPLSELEKELSLTGKVIEEFASLNGIERISPSRFYTALEVLKFGISYDELNQAMFKGLLQTQYAKKGMEDSASSKKSHDTHLVLTVSGESLMAYLQGREHNEIDLSTRVLTRAERLAAGRSELERKLQKTSEREEPSSNLTTFRHFVAYVKKIPLLTIQEETELLDRIAQGDRLALHDLVEANYRLVVIYALKARKSAAFDLMDAIQEGIPALYNAALNYSPKPYERGQGVGGRVRFITYASWAVRRQIERAFRNQGLLIRIPSDKHSKMSAVDRIQQYLMEQSGYEPTLEKIAETLGIPLATVKTVLEARNKTVVASLDMPLIGDEDVTLLDKIQDDSQADVAYAAASTHDQKILSSELEKSMKKKLTPKEQRVLRLRFGIGGAPHTLEEIGNEFGVTRERVRQIENKAKLKLKKVKGLEKCL